MNRMSIKNAKSLPERFFGLHMVEGVAEYAEPGEKPYRIYIGEDAIKNMNPSFSGKPVFVDHVDEVDLDNLESEMDGVVVRSFFNEADGKNWVEFIAITDRAKEAIRLGWKLSNAYIPKAFSGGGENHGVRFEKEVTAGEYEHLAIVQNPRYEESIILTPEQFKSYNEDKKKELTRLANSKGTKEKNKMAFKFNIFKRTRVENGKDGIDLTGLTVELPKSKSEMLLSEVVEQFDAIQNMHGYANGDHMVKLGEDEMSVNDLIKKHIAACNELEEMKSKNSGEGEPGRDIEDCRNDDDEEGTEDSGLRDVGDRGGDESLDNEDENERKDNEEDEEEDEERAKDKKKNAKERARELARKKAQALKNARPQPPFQGVPRVDLAIDQVARGKARYGSNA